MKNWKYQRLLHRKIENTIYHQTNLIGTVLKNTQQITDKQAFIFEAEYEIIQRKEYFNQIYGKAKTLIKIYKKKMK